MKLWFFNVLFSNVENVSQPEYFLNFTFLLPKFLSFEKSNSELVKAHYTNLIIKTKLKNLMAIQVEHSSARYHKIMNS